MHFNLPNFNAPIRRVNILAGAALAITLAAGFTAPAHAIGTQSDQIAVKINAEALETESGIERVYATLENKAKSACYVNYSVGLVAKKAAKDCANKLLADFVASVDHADLTAYHHNAIAR